MRVALDLETRSTVDIRTSGVWKYARHPSTDVICLSVKVDDEPSRIWYPVWVEEILRERPEIDSFGVDQVVENAAEIEAHNAGFELAIWESIMGPRYGLRNLPLEKVSCSAARAAVHALPRALGNACKVLGLDLQKDMGGAKKTNPLVLQMCKPRRPRKGEDPAGLYWYEDAERLRRLIAYCKTDTDAEAELSKCLRPLNAPEARIWRLDYEVNRRGVAIDKAGILPLLATLAKHEEALLTQMEHLTGGIVKSPRQIAALASWLASQGVSAPDFQKQTVDALLLGELPGKARKVLSIRRSLAKASTAKFAAMIDRVEPDGRCRDLAMYHGAGTGRWAGRGIQPQNLPRDSYDEIVVENVLDIFQTEDPELVDLLVDEPFVAASRCIRGSIIAGPGNDLVCADFSSIEARGTAWLAGQEDILAAFEEGKDLYKVAANDIFGCGYENVNKAQRQVGKTSELALGYGGGIAAYAVMARGYGIDLETLPDVVFPRATPDEREQAERTAAGYLQRQPGSMSLDAAIACDIIKQKWRAKRPRITRLWAALEEIALRAIEEEGVFRYRSVAYGRWKDARGNPYLVCQLPSRRLIYYFRPEIREVLTPWGKKREALTWMGVNSVTKQWERQKGTGGLLVENVVQALCRDLLAEAMLRVEAAGYPVVLHVHDEIVSEVAEGYGSLEEFINVMSEVPKWASGLPVKAEGWRGRRYRK